MTSHTPHLQSKSAQSHIGVFFSPPEPVKPDTFDSYSPRTTAYSPVMAKTLLPPFSTMLQSPPISPQNLGKKESVSQESYVENDRDPPLFHDRSFSDASQTAPLFEQRRPSGDVIGEHIAKRRRTLSRDEIPSRADYELIASLQHTVAARYNADPQGYIKKQLASLSAYPPLFPRKQTANITITPLKTRSGETGSGKAHRVSKPAAMPKLPRVRRAPKASPRTLPLSSPDMGLIDSPMSTKVPRTTPHRDDVDYSALPDYAPPVSTLGATSKALKIDWRGHPLDLSNDPDRHLLHEAEVSLASTLRLSCAQYLCSKRRIFAARLESYRNGKEFRKTTAQQACKIDVNKASKLWTAFDKVGWFDPKYMRDLARTIYSD